ncbi:hypothetical protein Tco_0491383 [Tanacetum coccineum]
MNYKTKSERVKRPGIQLAQESSKRLKTAKASGSEPSQEHQIKDSKKLSEEELKKMMEIVPVEEVYIKALQAKYPIIELEIYSKEQRKYWKIIRVGNHTEVYQIFEEMLKRFDREDLDRLWSLVKNTFSTTDPTEDKENELWVELKRLYEPDPRDQLWALQRYMHDPLEWRLYDTCGVHHVSTERGHEIFMLVEKDYPLTKGLTTLLLCNKLQVDQYSEMANELLIKIYASLLLAFRYILDSEVGICCFLSSFFFLAMAKQDMGVTVSVLTQENLGALVEKYHIPLDLHPRLPDPDFCINRLPNDAIVMSIYDFMTIPSWENADVGTPVPKLTLKEIAASQLDPKVAKKSKALVKRKASASAEEPSERDNDIKDTENADRENDLSEAAYYRYLKSILVKDKGVLSETSSMQSLRSGKRLGPPPPRSSNTSPSGLDCVGTSDTPNDHSYFDDHGGQGSGPTDVAERAQTDEVRRASGHIDMLAQCALGLNDGLS